MPEAGLEKFILDEESLIIKLITGDTLTKVFDIENNFEGEIIEQVLFNTDALKTSIPLNLIENNQYLLTIEGEVSRIISPSIYHYSIVLVMTNGNIRTILNDYPFRVLAPVTANFNNQDKVTADRIPSDKDNQYVPGTLWIKNNVEPNQVFILTDIINGMADWDELAISHIDISNRLPFKNISEFKIEETDVLYFYSPQTTGEVIQWQYGDIAAFYLINTPSGTLEFGDVLFNDEKFEMMNQSFHGEAPYLGTNSELRAQQLGSSSKYVEELNFTSINEYEEVSEIRIRACGASHSYDYNKMDLTVTIGNETFSIPLGNVGYNESTETSFIPTHVFNLNNTSGKINIRLSQELINTSSGKAIYFGEIEVVGAIKVNTRYFLKNVDGKIRNIYTEDEAYDKTHIDTQVAANLKVDNNKVQLISENGARVGSAITPAYSNQAGRANYADRAGTSNAAENLIDETTSTEYSTREIVTAISNIESDLENYVEIADIADTLDSTNPLVPLSARQGNALLNLINQIGAGVIKPLAVSALPTLEDAVVNTLYIITDTSAADYGNEYLCYQDKNGNKQYELFGNISAFLEGKQNGIILDLENNLEYTIKSITAKIQAGEIDSSYLIESATTDKGNILILTEDSIGSEHTYSVVGKGQLYKVVHNIETDTVTITNPYLPSTETDVVLDITTEEYLYSNKISFKDNDILTIDTRGRNSDNILPKPVPRTITMLGITHTFNADGTITLNGTVTTQADTDILLESYPTYIKGKYYTLKLFYVSGEFIGEEVLNVFSSMGASFNLQRTFIYSETNINAGQNSPLLITLDTGPMSRIRFSHRLGNTFNNYVVRLGLYETETLPNYDDFEYVPYGESTEAEIYDMSPNIIQLPNQTIETAGINITLTDKNTITYNGTSTTSYPNAILDDYINIPKGTTVFVKANVLNNPDNKGIDLYLRNKTTSEFEPFSRVVLPVGKVWVTEFDVDRITFNASNNTTFNGQQFTDFQISIGEGPFDFSLPSKEYLGTVKGLESKEITFTGHTGHVLQFTSLNGVNVDFNNTTITYHAQITKELFSSVVEQVEEIPEIKKQISRIETLVGEGVDVEVKVTENNYIYSDLTGFEDNGIITIETRGREGDNFFDLNQSFVDSLSGATTVEYIDLQKVKMTMTQDKPASSSLTNVNNKANVQPLDPAIVGKNVRIQIRIVEQNRPFQSNINFGFYDENKVLISTSGTAYTSNGIGLTNEITVPTNAKYIAAESMYCVGYLVEGFIGDYLIWEIQLKETSADFNEYLPYGESTDVEVYDRLPSSVLGKQDGGSSVISSTNIYFTFNEDGTITNNSFIPSTSKIITANNTDFYISVVKFNRDISDVDFASNVYMTDDSDYSNFRAVSRYITGSHLLLKQQFRNPMTNEPIGFRIQFNTLPSNLSIESISYINITEYNLENLTPQQVYDLLNTQLDLIASGTNVSELVGIVKGTALTQITFTGHTGHQLEFKPLNGINVDFTQTKLTYHTAISKDLITRLIEQQENLQTRVNDLEKENTDIKLELAEIRSILTNKADIGVNTIFKLASVDNELLLVENDIQVNENILIVPETNNFDFVRNLLVPLSFNAGQVVDLNIYVNTLSSNSRLNYNVTATIIKRVGGVDTVMGEATIVVYTQNNTYRSFIASILVDNATTLNVGEQLVVRLRSSDDTLVLLTGNEDEKSYLKYTQ